MEFKLTVEGYSGIKEYSNFTDFLKTFKTFIQSAKKDEVIRFNIFDVVSSKPIYNLPYFKMTKVHGIDLIKRALFDIKRPVTGDELSSLTKIAGRTIRRYLKELRETNNPWLLYTKKGTSILYSYKR